MMRLHALAKGRVQGVNFRRHVKGVADEHGLPGTVRNLPDGDVEIMVEGDEDTLRRFIDSIRDSPSPIRVDDILEDWSGPHGLCGTFEITR